MIVLLRLSAGLIGWAAAFCLVYGLHGIGCAAGWEARGPGAIGLHRLVLLAAWGVSLAATLAIALALHRRRGAAILGRASAATGWIGFAATAFTFLPILVVPACV